MKRCPSCAEKIQEAAVKCRFCGEVLTDEEASVLAQVAGAEIKLKTLLLSVPTYVRQFFQILKAPIRYFQQLNYAEKDGFKSGVAFMLQGIILSFVILTMRLAFPQSLASFFATNLPLITGSREQLAGYAKRVQEVKSVLPSALAKEWFKQGELMLAVRVLPEAGFQRMLLRVRELSAKDPDFLEHAIKGSQTFGGRFGGRAYILSFFMALDPRMVSLLQQTRQIVDIGPKYELKPHIDFLLRAILLWYLTCYVISRFMPAQPNDKKRLAVFTVGAYLAGFLNPLIQAFHTLVEIYLAIVLPKYIEKASHLLVNPEISDLGQFTSGVFPFENLMLVAINTVVPLVIVAIAIGAFVSGTRSAYQVSRSKAWAATCIGLALGFGSTELVGRLVVMILAPTGLL
jgi:hypothetical protein